MKIFQLFEKLSLQVRKRNINFKLQTIFYMSNMMMDVHPSWVNCQRSMSLQQYKHSNSHVWVCVRGSESVWAKLALTSLLSLGIPSYRWLLCEENGLMSRGKILLQHWPLFERALNGNVFWESCRPDLTRHHEPHQRLHSPCSLTRTLCFNKNSEHIIMTGREHTCTHTHTRTHTWVLLNQG